MPAKRKPGKIKYKYPGQPTKMTPITIGKLDEAFAMGCTDIEACLFAGIHQDTLYAYQRKNPEYIKRKAALKETPVLKARKTIENALEEDQNTAKWYLERKLKDELGTNQKTEVEITNIEDVINALQGE